MCKYNVVMEMQNATVVSEYEPEKNALTHIRVKQHLKKNL